jgi:hypothetical protein
MIREVERAGIKILRFFCEIRDLAENGPGSIPIILRWSRCAEVVDSGSPRFVFDEAAREQ